ncbi:unnamed protein product [Caenorhabditis auriculariae]|uniref:Uncharacterized protein n=1 Tax=Caenorhabditis auriculariae TaxID=2777116 RepID=A0A8S1H2M4_9PELO|nr:unnamed protein product [Caenorhabditis auriculariae]
MNKICFLFFLSIMLVKAIENSELTTEDEVETERKCWIFCAQLNERCNFFYGPLCDGYLRCKPIRDNIGIYGEKGIVYYRCIP